MPKEYQPHELGAMFPSMGEAEYKALCDSIKQNGLQEDIVLYEGKILDGNHRYTACVKVKVQPTFMQFDSSAGITPLSFVTMKNLARRNLTPSQAAAVAVEIAERLKKIDEEDAKIAAKAKPEPAKSGAKASTPKSGGETTTAGKAAAIMGVSRASVHKAAAVKKADPVKFGAVKSGKVTVNAAKKSVDKVAAKKMSESDLFKVAIEMIGAVFSKETTKAITDGKRLKPKEVIELSRLPKDKMKPLEGLIANGWSLKEATSYKVTALTKAHTIRQLLDRTMAQGNSYCLEMDGWIIEVSRKKSEASETAKS